MVWQVSKEGSHFSQINLKNGIFVLNPLSSPQDLEFYKISSGQFLSSISGVSIGSSTIGEEDGYFYYSDTQKQRYFLVPIDYKIDMPLGCVEYLEAIEKCLKCQDGYKIVGEGSGICQEIKEPTPNSGTSSNNFSGSNNENGTGGNDNNKGIDKDVYL